MKVKIKNKIYDAENEPIMIVFSSLKERKGIINHLKNMEKTFMKYCMYPEEISIKKIKKFME